MSFADQVAGAIGGLAQAVGVTRRRAVKLGTPEGQVIPPPGTAPAGRLWVHDPDTLEVFLVQNTDPGLSYDHTSAGVLVDIGYRPGEEVYSIIGVNPVRGLQETGGALPSQIAQVQASIVAADKITNFSLTANGTLTLGCIGGLAVFGVQVRELLDTGSFVDLTSHVPATVNTGRIVAVGWNGAAPVVVQGTTYDTTQQYTSTAFRDLHPYVLSLGVLLMGYVYLKAGMTGIERTNIRPAPHIFTVAPAPFGNVPASASAPGHPGQLAYDADFFYICVAANTWKRTALTGW